MRLSLAIVLAVAIAVAVYAAKRPDDSPAHATGSATLVGDSLNVGIERYLGDELPGWGVDAHDRVGRATQEGIDELRSLGGASLRSSSSASARTTPMGPSRSFASS